MCEKSMIILIAGGSGSGKSTVADYIAGQFPTDAIAIRHDDYYRYQSETEIDARALVNYDRPEAYETELLEQHLKMLCDGVAVDAPVYDFGKHNRSSDIRHIEPKPIILIDGILVLAEERIRSFADLCVFVDTDEEIRLERRIQRDGRERNRSRESVIEQYNRTVKPMHDRYVEPSKMFADVILCGDGENRAEWDALVQDIRTRMQAK